MLTLEIPGEPTAKERPRKGAQGHFYTPAKTRAAEGVIALLARSTRQTFEGHVRLSVSFYTDSERFDLDNAFKLVADGLEKGGVFKNDRQVKEGGFEWFPANGRPRTVIRVCERALVESTTSTVV